MSLITIDQLLESVDLDFEPRWVTKSAKDMLIVWAKEPQKNLAHTGWVCPNELRFGFGKFKVAEFDGKDWQECIYEVPRKEELKDKIKIGTLYIDKSVTFGDGDDDDVGVVLEDYEVPQKTDEYEQNLEKLRPADSDLVYRVNLPRKTTGGINKIEIIPCKGHTTALSLFDITLKVNEIIDKIETLEERTEDVCARIIEVERKVL